jgi:hypothetical protein
VVKGAAPVVVVGREGLPVVGAAKKVAKIQMAVELGGERLAGM